MRLQVAASIAFAVVFGLILSVKDIIFIRRDLAAHAAYFIILGFLTFFFFAGMFGEFGQVATTISIFLVAREFYRSVVKNSLAVYPLFAAFLYSEILWAIYAIPIGFTAKSALAMVAMFLSSDVIVHHLKNNLSVKVVLRNVAVFILFLLAILQVVAGS
ncbi:MAG: hypothetical protein A3B23_02405 [Candidatus Colwellbacteria bacterium RIFCSPLOWO2_01_FULL_48_10]|uniref:Uncharacterized protein n=1 Tax=Candidatus Colwellbacteria bacterium RIFCSPLOWO2_01_FULL_48_10 TaxID=1797690 RepID=A0A1G1Z5S3_9BACT|nr:MAG: hypothetical protein A3B23_02405 [Candidatus Colwellbacteria bacterium RIFCSPLOWO2_01_FULL_48_10]